MKELIKLYIRNSISKLIIIPIPFIIVCLILKSKISIDNNSIASFLIPVFSILIIFMTINMFYETAFVEVKEGINEFIMITPINYKKLLIIRSIFIGLISYLMTNFMLIIFFYNLTFSSFNLIFFSFVTSFIFSVSYSLFGILVMTPFVKQDIRVKNIFLTFSMFVLVYFFTYTAKYFVKHNISINYFIYFISGFVLIVFLTSVISLKFYKKSFLLR